MYQRFLRGVHRAGMLPVAKSQLGQDMLTPWRLQDAFTSRPGATYRRRSFGDIFRCRFRRNLPAKRNVHDGAALQCHYDVRTGRKPLGFVNPAKCLEV